MYHDRGKLEKSKIQIAVEIIEYLETQCLVKPS
jgi:hypothetical protein